LFCGLPACEQGGSTNQITIWATDSSSPPKSNSVTFTVTVGDCVQVSVGSNMVQAGQSACVPANLVTSVGLTNLNFSLAYTGGFLTNWNVTPSNSGIASATAQTVDPSHTQFNFAARNGRSLQGAIVLGSLCLDTLPGASAFVPLMVTNMGAAALNNSPIATLIGQQGRVVVVGPQSFLEAMLDTNSGRTLTLYGNPRVTYDLLSTTNLGVGSSWSTMSSVILTELFQTIGLGSMTNQAQFIKAVQP